MDALKRREEMSDAEGGAEQGFQFGHGLGGRMVFSDIVSRVAPKEGELGAGLQRNRADVEIAQGGRRGGREGFAQREFYEGAGGDGGAELDEKAASGVGWGCGFRHDSRFAQRAKVGTTDFDGPSSAF